MSHAVGKRTPETTYQFLNTLRSRIAEEHRFQLTADGFAFYRERSNLSIRMALRRFTRLTNSCSKKLDNLKFACALYFAYYSFCRVHQSIRVSPAVEAGITDHIWTLRELLAR